MKQNTRWSLGKPLVERFKSENEIHPMLFVSWGGTIRPGTIFVRLGDNKARGRSIPYDDAVKLNRALHRLLPIDLSGKRARAA